MDINYIGVPMFYGCDKEGPQYGPDKLREKNIIEILRTNNHEVYDMGNLYVPKVSEDDKFSFNSKMKYLKPIVDVNTNLAHVVASSLRMKCFPLIVGGDHSIGLGSISGVSSVYEDIGVIWFDAHGDINTHESSESGNVHGMPLAAAMGIGHSDLTNVYFKERKVKPENVFILGARDLDEGENTLIKEKNLNVYTPDEIRKRGIENILNEINEKLNKNNIKAVHLSFDMDFIDKKFVPGTGTPVDNGFNIEETKDILRKVISIKLIKSMEIVELNTILDENDSTLNIAIDILDLIFKNI